MSLRPLPCKTSRPLFCHNPRLHLQPSWAETTLPAMRRFPSPAKDSAFRSLGASCCLFICLVQAFIPAAAQLTLNLCPRHLNTCSSAWPKHHQLLWPTPPLLLYPCLLTPFPAKHPPPTCLAYSKSSSQGQASQKLRKSSCMHVSTIKVRLACHILSTQAYKLDCTHVRSTRLPIPLSACSSSRPSHAPHGVWALPSTLHACLAFTLATCLCSSDRASSLYTLASCSNFLD